MSLSTLAILIVGLAFLAWLGFLFSSSVSEGAGDELPPNLTPGTTDAEMETRRLDRVLAAGVVLSVLMAIILPLYYLGEEDRQEGFEEEFAETSVERGEGLFLEFQCINCHGAEGVGGVAAFVEQRSGVATVWAAPPLNDLLYRYDRDEARFWIVYGRAGAPMPPWGLEGGGPLNTQQVDELLDYIESIQISQEEALAQIETRVGAELTRLEQAEATIQQEIADQEALIAAIEAAPSFVPTAQSLVDQMRDALSAAESGVDSDGDGLADVVEQQISGITAQAVSAGLEARFGVAVRAITLDPSNPASTTVAGQTVPDGEAASEALAELQAALVNYRVTTDNQGRLLPAAQSGLEFLRNALEERPYEIDFQAIADQVFGGDVEMARRAAALYNAYCARCHTAGYSAGIAFTREAGSGAFGPSLIGGRSVVQFPDVDEQIDFIINGSENGAQYGVNGIGSGRMPGFGPTLTIDDIELIVMFERGL